jgi:thioredoxin 1
MAAEGVMEFTNDNFQALVLESEKPVLVDFWAEWCGPCRAIAPAIDQIAFERDDIVVGKVDIDAHPELAQRYGIQGIPFIGLFENGALARQAVGAQPKASIERALGLAE